jgi:hypothetical protein
MRTDRAASLWSSYTYKFKGCRIDDGAFNDYVDFGLDHTFTYESGSYVESNRQYYVNKIAWVPAFSCAMDSKIGQALTIYIENIVSPYYSCGDWNQSGKGWMKEYLQNCYDECWLVTGGSGPLTMDKIPCWLNCPFLEYCEQGKGYVFAARSINNSDRERRFTLATFYMVNHQMAFYSYRAIDHMPGQNDEVWDWQWNPYVPFDVGQPIVNTLNKLDFQGNSGTNRYFVFAQDDSYKVLGREYIRSDGTKVLVLTKIMASGCSEGQSPTTHSLPRCYREVLPDLTLGNVVSSVALYNNDGVILVETTCPPSGGGKGPEPGQE